MEDELKAVLESFGYDLTLFNLKYMGDGEFLLVVKWVDQEDDDNQLRIEFDG